MSTEEWRAVVGYEGIYEVSSHGRVRRQTNTGWRKLNSYRTSSGHLMIGLTKFKKRKQVMVHRIVAEAFIGLIPPKMLVHPIDTCKTNNKVDNLEIVTTQFNTQHACDAGLIKHAKGEKHGRAKLTESEVVSLKQLVRQGISLTNVARTYSTTLTNVCDIMKGRRWKHLA